MIHFGMPTLIENHTLQDNIDLCESLGLRFIELNMNFPEYQTDELQKTDELIRAAEKAGIYFTIHLDENLNIADFNRLVSDAYLETVRQSVEVSRKLMALRDRYDPERRPLTLNMHMNPGIYITLPDRKVQMYERDFETYMKSFAAFRSLCEEWIGEASPVFGLTWDIGHSKAIHETDVPFITEHQDRLIHFHIHDATETPAKNHLALGDGELDLTARLQLAAQRNARCVLETKTIEALKKSVAWLKEHQLWNT